MNLPRVPFSSDTVLRDTVENLEYVATMVEKGWAEPEDVAKNLHAMVAQLRLHLLREEMDG